MSALNAYRNAFFKYMNQHERWQGLMEVQTEFDGLTFWRLFREIWDRTTALYPHHEPIRRMLSAERINSSDRLAAWTLEDREWMKRAIRRGKPIKIYRGGCDFNVTGLSWSVSADNAAPYAYLSGFEEGTLAVGRIQPMHVILANSITREIVAFPEHINIERVDKIRGAQEPLLTEARLRAVVAAKGANEPAGVTQGAFINQMIDAGKVEREKMIQHFNEGRKVLDSLGFKSRVVTIDSIIEELENGVRSAA